MNQWKPSFSWFPFLPFSFLHFKYLIRKKFSKVFQHVFFCGVAREINVLSLLMKATANIILVSKKHAMNYACMLHFKYYTVSTFKYFAYYKHNIDVMGI